MKKKYHNIHTKGMKFPRFQYVNRRHKLSGNAKAIGSGYSKKDMEMFS